MVPPPPPPPSVVGAFASQMAQVDQLAFLNYSHHPSHPVDLKRLEKYVSVKEKLIRLATKVPYNMSVIDVENALTQLKGRIHCHYDPEVQSFTEEEQKWLAEGLFFKRLYPDHGIGSFEGQRPHNPVRRRYQVNVGVFPPCKGCKLLNIENVKKCPFVEVHHCRRGHKPYFTRFGAEPKLDGCPQCRKVAEAEGWVNDPWAQF